jgi:hypothetical protein
VQQPDGSLINPPSGLCLDDGGSTTNGFQLMVQPCVTGSGAQQFSVNGGNPITSLMTGKCVDVYGDDTGVNLTPVDMWDCQQNAADQHWVYNAASQTLSTLGRCLSISVAQGVGGTGTGVAGDRTVLFDCNGSGVEQWVAQPDGALYNPPSGLCLDEGGSTTNGFQLYVQPCAAGSGTQQFSVYVPGGFLVNANPNLGTGKCVDVRGDDTGVNGTPVQLYDCQPTAKDQHWIYTSAGQLETLGRCLSVSVAQGVGGTGQAVAGDRTVLWDCNGSSVEHWVATSNGFFEMYSGGQLLCLDSPGGSTANGWQLEVWGCNGQPNQQYFLGPP